jgi:glycosyltransferase involved in cell wall biosynthesis
VYKNAAHLKRLLDSVFSQTFTDYEVIITDDTPDDSIRAMLQENFKGKPLQYVYNHPALGTPENWNAAIGHAKGQWIKLMHNDDWFAHENVLQTFFDAVQANPGVNFFFSAFVNITEKTGYRQFVRMNGFDRLFLKMSPLHLFRKVYVGNPSCTLVKNGLGISYDKQFKFVVDFDYYIRLIQAGHAYKYIDRYLLHIGFHEEQVTQYTKLNPSVQIFENVRLLKQYGAGILKNVFVFDYYWRLFRNIAVTNLEDAQKYIHEEFPAPLIKMLWFQSKIPLRVLKMGVVSKMLMSMAYLRNLAGL